jgi:nucleoside-diphosphate-sugar epimerase
MMKQKILICGGTGFIGQNLVEHFSKQDCELVATYLKTDPPKQLRALSCVKWVKADLTQRDTVDALVKGTDVIIQAAATTSGAKEILGKPYYHVTDNALMNSLLLRASFDHKIKHFVFFSCTVMYKGSDKPVQESEFDHEISKNYFGVGWTKVYIEKMCDFYSRISPTKFSVIRHSNIYGPHDKYDLERSHVFGATVTKVMTNQDGKIVVWGEGTEERDLLYVDDLVEFVDLVLRQQKNNYELLNIGLGKSISVKDLVTKIIQCSGRALTIEFDRSKPTIPYKLALNIDRAMQEYGWKPRTSLDEGIRKTLQWYKKNYKSEESAVPSVGR